MTAHRCSFCGEDVDITEAGDNPSKIAVLLLAHIKLACTGAPGVGMVIDIREDEARASAELTSEGYFAHWDAVSMGGVMLRTHHERTCKPPCCIHSPSGHHMREWSQAWSQELGAVFRLCPHGRFHPDPDDLQARTGGLLHQCDGCCLAPVTEENG